MPAADRPASSIAAAAVQPKAPQRATQSFKRTLITRPIQDIVCGQRVIANNPQLAGQDVPQLEIDPEFTRLVSLHMLKPDGRELDIDTLVSLDTLLALSIEQFEADVEAAGPPVLLMPPVSMLPTSMPSESMLLVDAADDVSLNELLVGQVIEMNLPELGADGPATITSIRPCPPIEPDDGTGRRLVTSVFRHSAANVVDLQTSGSESSIGVTTNHPFWSEDRQEFIPAGDLRPGENLRRADSTLVQVTGITPRHGPPVPVFNFEVDGEHVYSVGADGLLVHNTCKLNISNTVISRPGIHHIASRYDSRFVDLFKNAGLSMESAFNKVKIVGHQGPHGWYNDLVFKRLTDATRGKTGAGMRKALTDELMELRWQLKNTDLGDLVRAAAN